MISMRRSLAFSLFFHLVILLLLSLFLRRELLSPHLVQVELSLSAPKPQAPSAAPEQSVPRQKPAAGAPARPQAENPVPAAADSAVTDSQWRNFTASARLRQQLLNLPVTPSGDSAILSQKKAIDNALAALPPARPPRDLAGEFLHRWNEGGTPLLLNPAGLGGKREWNASAPSFTFIPGRDQLEALSYLWRHDTADQLDLYANLPDSLPLTAESFNSHLDHLVQKGFLRRRKVSPQNLLTFSTPLGCIPLELSPQNRRNPVWEYSVTVDKTLLTRFLQARLTFLQDSLARAEADKKPLLRRHIKELEQKLLIIRK